MAKGKTYYYLVFILSIFFWSSNFVVARGLLISGVDYNLLSLIRAVLALGYFSVILILKHKPLHYPELKKNFLWIFGMAISGITAFNLLANIGLQYEEAGRSALINSINPSLIVIMGALVFKEQLTKRRIFGTVISFLGILMVTLTSYEGLIYHLDFNRTDLIFLGTGLCATLYSTFNRLLGDNIDYNVGLFWTFLIGVLTLLPFSVTKLPEIASLSLVQWLELIYLGIVCGGFCNLIWYQALMVIGVGNVGLINSFTPLFSIIAAWLFLGEQLTGVLIGGAIILTFGVWLGVSHKPTATISEDSQES